MGNHSGHTDTQHPTGITHTGTIHGHFTDLAGDTGFGQLTSTLAIRKPQLSVKFESVQQ